jgi:hypothetical protein
MGNSVNELRAAMTIINRVIPVLFACGSMLTTPLSRADTTIVIVRHGEKPAQGLGQLSCQGLNRALGLPTVLLSRYGNPVAIYAPNPAIKKIDKGISYAYIRPLATIEPLAIRVGLPVNLEWGMSDISPLAKQLMAQADGTLIVVWEHHYGEKLAKYLLSSFGGDPSEIPSWDDADFDSIFVIRATGSTQGKRHATFTREQENLNGLPIMCAK